MLFIKTASIMVATLGGIASAVPLTARENYLAFKRDTQNVTWDDVTRQLNYLSANGEALGHALNDAVSHLGNYHGLVKPAVKPDGIKSTNIAFNNSINDATTYAANIKNTVEHFALPPPAYWGNVSHELGVVEGAIKELAKTSLTLTVDIAQIAGDAGSIGLTTLGLITSFSSGNLFGVFEDVISLGKEVVTGVELLAVTLPTFITWTNDFRGLVGDLIDLVHVVLPHNASPAPNHNTTSSRIAAIVTVQQSVNAHAQQLPAIKADGEDLINTPPPSNTTAPANSTSSA